jgi:hypothetical protein
MKNSEKKALLWLGQGVEVKTVQGHCLYIPAKQWEKLRKLGSCFIVIFGKDSIPKAIIPVHAVNDSDIWGDYKLRIVPYCDKGITTIEISRELRNWLATQGTKDDTFEDILRRLLKFNGAQP